MLPEIIDNSIDVEEHADYKKKNGIRSIENGIADNNIIYTDYMVLLELMAIYIESRLQYTSNIKAAMCHMITR